MSLLEYTNKLSSKTIFEVKSNLWGQKLAKVKLDFIEIVKEDESYSKHFLEPYGNSLQPDIIRDCNFTNSTVVLLIKHDHLADFGELIPILESLIRKAFE